MQIAIRRIAPLIGKFLSILWGNAYSALSNLIIASIFISRSGLQEYGFLVLLQSLYYAWSSLSKPQTWQAIVKYSPKNGLSRTTKNSIRIETKALIYTPIIFALLALLAESTGKANFQISEYVLFFLSSLVLNNGTTVGYLRYTSRFNLLSLINGCLATAKIATCVYSQNAIEYFRIFLAIDMLVWSSAAIMTISSLKSAQDESYNQESTLAEISRFSWWGTFHLVLDLPVAHLDKIIISYFLGIETAAAVNLIRRLSLIVGQISDPLYHVVLQKFTHLINNKNFKEAWSIGKNISLFTITLGIILSITSVHFFDILDNALFSNKLSEYKWLFSAYLLAYLVGLAFIWIHPFFLTAGLMRENSIILASANSVYIVMLISLSTIGAWGAFIAFSTQVAISITPKIIYLKFHEKRAQEIDPQDHSLCVGRQRP